MKSDLRSALRLKLVGKPMVGFDTKRWVESGSMASSKPRIGTKPGGGGGGEEEGIAK